jgi:hypothetical protein
MTNRICFGVKNASEQDIVDHASNVPPAVSCSGSGSGK